MERATPDVAVPVGREVAGTVSHVDGSPIAELLVQAFHRQLGGEQPLGVEVLTDDRGHYRIGYQLLPGLSKVDLFVRAYGDQQAVAGVSPILIGADAQAVLDITVADPRYRGPSEFAKATSALSGNVTDVQLADLDANDVALLVRNTGLTRPVVTAWIAAGRLADRTGLDPESCYGLIRTQQTASLPRLLRRPPTALVHALTGATNANVISFGVGQRAKASVKRLRQLAVRLSNSTDTPSSLGRLLRACTTATPAQQGRFLQRYADHDGPIQGLWGALRADPDFGDAAVDDLQLSLRLGTLTANHPPLVKALRANGVAHVAQTAAIDAAGWQRLLSTEVDGQPVGVPPTIKGTTDAGRAANYITLIQERCARALPTSHVAGAVKTLPGWQQSPAVSFLDANPDYNLLTAQVGASLDRPDVLVQPDWDRARLDADLSTLQRVARVSPRGKEAPVTNALLTSGHTSALSIARQSRATFQRRTAAALGDQGMADAVYRNAQFQVARAGLGYASMHPEIGAGYVAAVGTGSTAADDPTWASLFGDVDYCACPECRSIYSPAAYFVDLLSWLDGHEAGGKTAFERLDKRRPDLQRIELSCDNTNTVLPYADLLNEILEARVLGTPAPQASTATSPELLADPEYLNAAAYDDHLVKAVYPHVLPFDLWTALGRMYFEHLGVRRSDLMETLRRAGTPGPVNVDAERLGLAPAERRILTGTARHDVWDYWGYRSATPDGQDYKVDLAVVSTLLDRAGIEYDELLDLLHSRVVNADGAHITGAVDDTDAMTVRPLTDQLLDRMQIFLRLWRNRGWSMLDLDKALYALGISDMDGAGLARLADLDRVLTLTSAPLLDVLSWWAPMDTFADRPEKEEPVSPLYNRVFLNRAVDAGAEDPDFPLALNPAGTDLARPVGWIDVAPLLQAALTLDADELALLEAATVQGEVSLAGLSALYRNVSLARSLGLTVTDLLGLLRLTGITPFDVTDTGEMVRLLDVYAQVQAAPFALTELHYLLEHDAQAEISVGVTDELIGQTLVEIRDGLARVAEDYPVAPDPTGEITARYLALALPADEVATVLAALRSADPSEVVQTLIQSVRPLFPVDARAVSALPVERRFDALLSGLAPYLQETLGNGVIIEKVAGFAGCGRDSAQDLLALRLRLVVDGTPMSALAGLRQSPFTSTTSTELTSADDPDAFLALRRVYKVALVLDRLDLDIDGQGWLFDVGVRNGLLDPLTLPVEPQPVAPGAWEAWLRLVDVAALATDLPGGEPTLVELLQLLESDSDAAAKEAFLSAVATRTGWPRGDLDYLEATFTPAFPVGWRDGRVLRGLVDAFALLGRLGVPAATADAWATADIGTAEAEQLRLATKSKHDEESWPAIARALRDPVRDAQRAALVAFLLADGDYADEAALSADLLIDVDMSPCMLTSRLKQAISSVQLFVQRAFLNLEQHVEFTRDDQAQWAWMQNYRVWEAARKVFLYPENWTDPELRTDKSALFEQLENALSQGQLTDAAAEQAYTAYLEGLLKIARLEVMGLFHQYEDDADGTLDVLHVVGRTASTPHEHYYRQWVDGREWTAWEPLDVDIDADHVVLAVHDRRLFVFWPVVTQKASASYGSDVQTNPPVQTDYFEMQLAWVERMNGQWGTRRISDGYLSLSGKWQAGSTTDQDGDGHDQSTYFRLAEAGRLTIECRRVSIEVASRPDHTLEIIQSPELVGSFVLDPVTGSMVRHDTSHDVDLVAPPNGTVDRMYFDLEDDLTIMDGTADDEGHLVGDAEPVSLATVSSMTIAYPHQFGEFASQYGVFCADDNRTFFVQPEPSLDLDRLADHDMVVPSDVTTTSSASDVFTPPKEDPPFEPDLDWDKEQEPPILANKGAQRAIAANAVLDGAALDQLSTTGLQHSQTQLNEVGQTFDSMAMATISKYRFALFYHPYVGDFLTELRRSGVSGLLDPSPDGSAPKLVRQQKSRPDFFVEDYAPTSRVLEPYPVQDIDFAVGGAYSKYNWELFFHAPMLIAARLTREQRFDEARRWFHFMFDPTNRSDDEDPLRFWKIKPFYRTPDAPIEDFLALAASEDSSAEAEQARSAYDDQVQAWLADPFNPDKIAETRTTAYQKTLVMKYLDNLIAWGDQLFRQDTIESINEATQLYVLALQLLGDRPDALPERSEPVATTFEQIRGSLDDSVLSNPLVELENLTFRPSEGKALVSPITAIVNSWSNLLLPRLHIDAAKGFYFAIPPNDILLSYWDTVEDRLFKIRHCMNIEGAVRELPLFEPPLDPGMLVRARAAGIDLSSALSDLSAPLPLYRFAAMVQKAYALNQTVRGLGSALLSALEKADAEALSVLRASQEEAVLTAVREAKEQAVEEAQHNLAGAQQSLAVVQSRRDYYQRMISEGLRPEEMLQLALMEEARTKQTNGSREMLIAAVLTAIPSLVTGASGAMGTPVATSNIVSGLSLAKGVELHGQNKTITAASLNAQASSLGTMGSFIRRGEEWLNQLNSANLEMTQVQKQIDAATVRVSMAQRDLDNHNRQIDNARSVREFLEQKFTNGELYQWMIGQLSTLFFQSYQLAYDLAKQAERAYSHELAQPDATFIQFGYWDSLKKGLLAGERLQYDLERMDAAYLQNNVREYELTRHVSLAQLDPVALTQLRTGGSCEFSIPEALFDLDYPGHYLRRIRSVSVTVPCVTGPYTPLPMRLTLVSSRTRMDPTATGDAGLQASTGAVQSIAICNGRDDGGLFGDQRDDRRLPFEGSGAISDWNLTLTSAVPLFDPTTITDVILHVRYTAREGGEPLRASALQALQAGLAGLPLRRAFSARSEFPSEWNAFLRPADGSAQATLSVELAERLFPYLAHDAGLKITHLELVAQVKDPDAWRSTQVTVTAGTNVQQPDLVGSAASYGRQPSASADYGTTGLPPGRWDIAVPVAALGPPSEWADDLILIATYQLKLDLP